MPAIMTHDFFGRDACGEASELLGGFSPEQRAAFLLGNQGPDPLFYLVVDPRVDASMRVGSLMHHERPARQLAALHDALGALSARERPLGEAYAAGYLCHYLLDSTLHPLVFATQYALCDAGVEGLDRTSGSLVHAEIERDLDEMVLFERTGLTVRAWRPYREVLGASDTVLACVGKLYFYLCLWTYGNVLDADVFGHAVKAFRLAQRLFWTPAGTGRRVVGPVERLVTGQRYSLYCAMAHRDRPEARSDFANAEHRTWENPFTGAASAASFWDLYEAALGRTTAAWAAFFDPGFDRRRARELTSGLNFSGAPVDEDAPVGSLRFD